MRMRCPKCGGFVLWEPGRWFCILCGWERWQERR
jgi:ribosomal protein S27AE